METDTKPTPKKGSKPPRDWKPRFLQLIAASGSITKACRACRIDRTTPYKAREYDSDFAAKWDAALDVACDLLEDELRRRALKGSDTCLIFALKSYRPAIFSERYRFVHSVADTTAPVPIHVIYDPTPTSPHSASPPDPTAGDQ
jgi:hypothetical protein